MYSCETCNQSKENTINEKPYPLNMWRSSDVNLCFQTVRYIICNINMLYTLNCFAVSFGEINIFYSYATYFNIIFSLMITVWKIFTCLKKKCDVLIDSVLCVFVFICIYLCNLEWFKKLVLWWWRKYLDDFCRCWWRT